MNLSGSDMHRGVAGEHIQGTCSEDWCRQVLALYLRLEHFFLSP